MKPKLTDSPFVQEFEYGASSKGYWTYESMVLQLEDCVDVLKMLYPEFQFLFLFDHSCGHDKAREDALNARNMNTMFGGSVPKMHDTVLREANGYLGLFEHDKKLHVGDTQRMVFAASDVGPFWLTDVQREATKFDIELPKTVEERYTMKQLRDKLTEKDVDITGVRVAERMSTVACLLVRKKERRISSRV